MGIQKVGARCCNNCIYWKCHSDRHFQGNPPKTVFVSDTIATCTHSQSPHKNKTISQAQCCMFFRHFGGVTETFELSSGGGAASSQGSIVSGDDSGLAFLKAAGEFAALSGGGRSCSGYSSEELAWIRKERARKAAERRTWQYWFLLPGRCLCYPWVKWWGFERDAWREKDWISLGIWSFLGFLLLNLYKFAVPFLLAFIGSSFPTGLVNGLVIGYACVAVYLARNKIGAGRFLKPVENLISALHRKK